VYFFSGGGDDFEIVFWVIKFRSPPCRGGFRRGLWQFL
jgi:hypothetical protein